MSPAAIESITTPEIEVWIGRSREAAADAAERRHRGLLGGGGHGARSSRHVRGSPWLDLAALFGHVFPKNETHRIRYFTARVDRRPPHFQQHQQQQAYLRALDMIPELSIHYGRFRTRPVQMRLEKPRRGGQKTVRVLKTEEKGSDVNLASYLLLDAFRKDCEVAIVVSNDADLKTPIELASSELGIPVGVLNPHPAKRRSLVLQPTFFKQLREGPLAASQFAPVLRDSRGEIRKPKGW